MLGTDRLIRMVRDARVYPIVAYPIQVGRIQSSDTWAPGGKWVAFLT